MASQQKVSVKWSNNGEFRRFAIELSDTEDAYASLWRKLHSLEPSFQGRIGWKDSDGDNIVIASDIEMQEAIRATTGDVLRLYTIGETPASTPVVASKTVFCADPPLEAETPRDPRRHVGVECDVCKVNPIIGARYKCLTCDDYDLCAECHDAKNHEEHAMIRIADVNDHSWRAIFHRRGPHGRLGGGRGPRCGRFNGPPGAPGFGPPRGPCGPPRGPCGPPRGPGGRPGCGPPKSHSFDHFGSLLAGLNGHFAQHANATGENVNEYLKNVGQVVADALGNIGIDVDVDVEDKEGKRQNVDKTASEKGEQTNDKPVESKEQEPLIAMDTQTVTTTTTTETPIVQQPTPEVQVFDNGNWQFVDSVEPTADGKLYPSVPSAPPAQEMETMTIEEPAAPEPMAAEEPTTSAAANAKVEAAKSVCLAHLLNMGFTNENGWLEAIVEAKHGDLNAVLSTLQRK